VLALLGESGVVEDERLSIRQLAIELQREARKQLGIRPPADGDAFLKPLSHRLSFAGIVNEPTRHRLDALSISIEQEPGEVGAQRLAPFPAPHPIEQLRRVCGELRIEPLDLASLHRRT
jgi:hypothetical protein